MKVIYQHLYVVLLIMLFKVFLNFKSVEETLVCDQSNESYQEKKLKHQQTTFTSPHVMTE